jgi:hypothetical protein
MTHDHWKSTDIDLGCEWCIKSIAARPLEMEEFGNVRQTQTAEERKENTMLPVQEVTADWINVMGSPLTQIQITVDTIRRKVFVDDATPHHDGAVVPGGEAGRRREPRLVRDHASVPSRLTTGSTT